MTISSPGPIPGTASSALRNAVRFASNDARPWLPRATAASIPEKSRPAISASARRPYSPSDWTSRWIASRRAVAASRAAFAATSPDQVSSGRAEVPGSRSRPATSPALPNDSTAASASHPIPMPSPRRAGVSLSTSGSVAGERTRMRRGWWPNSGPTLRSGSDAALGSVDGQIVPDALVAGLPTQIAEPAGHVTRLEAERGGHGVGCRDVVEPQLAELIARDGKRKADELRGSGDEPDERNGHRHDEPPRSHAVEDLADDLA